MTDETEDQEHGCYGVLRLVTPLPIEQQLPDDVMNTAESPPELTSES